MGLDAVDITFRLEREFGVTFSQDELTGLVRDGDVVVGDLYNALLEKLHLRDVGRSSVRVNYALWRQVHEAIRRATDVPRETVELKTPLERIFPRDTRREAWERLRNALPYRVRELDYPKPVRVIGFVLAGGMAFLDLFQIWQLPGMKWLLPLLSLFGIWMFVETYAKVLGILRPFRNSLPSRMVTVKDLCHDVLAANYRRVCQDAAIEFDDRSVAVWHKLVEILVAALGVDAEEITFRTRLIRDLGME